MAMNRVQFQAGLSMREFMARYGTEAQCAAAWRPSAGRWVFAVRPAACGGAEHRTFDRAGRRYGRCGACRHQTTVIAGTIFAATKLPLTVWFLAIHLLTQATNNVAALKLKRHLGVCYPSATAGRLPSYPHAPMAPHAVQKLQPSLRMTA